MRAMAIAVRGGVRMTPQRATADDRMPQQRVLLLRGLRLRAFNLAQARAPTSGCCRAALHDATPPSQARAR